MLWDCLEERKRVKRKGKFDTKPLSQTITQDRYKDVYWSYDFYLNIDTTHPYAGKIRYKMNFKPTIMKVPQRGIVFQERISDCSRQGLGSSEKKKRKLMT